MKKSIPPILAAIALLSACAKVETAPSSPDGMAISFSPVLGSVRTKAGTAQPTQNFTFISHAWYLPDGKNWEDDKAEAEPYIVNERITGFYDSGYLWKPADGTTYYWPRGGSLTFLSYTCVSEDQSTIYDGLFTGTDNGTVRIDKTDGLTITDFTNYITGDLLVADIEKDKRAGLNGVPTVFRHKLAKVSIHVSKEKTEDNYTITKISFTNIYHTATYSRGGYPDDEWSKRKNFTSYNMAPSSGSQSENFEVPAKPGLYASNLIIPQNLLATGQNETDGPRNIPQIIISYTKNGEAPTDIVRNLEDLGTNYWDKGKEYKYYITFGSGDNPINFSGSIGEWKDEDNSGVDIGTK